MQKIHAFVNYFEIARGNFDSGFISDRTENTATSLSPYSCGTTQFLLFVQYRPLSCGEMNLVDARRPHRYHNSGKYNVHYDNVYHRQHRSVPDLNDDLR